MKNVKAEREGQHLSSHLSCIRNDPDTQPYTQADVDRQRQRQAEKKCLQVTKTQDLTDTGRKTFVHRHKHIGINRQTDTHRKRNG